MSWNYTQTDKNLTLSFPKLDFSKFTRDRLREKDRMESAYVNRESPTNQPEVVKIRRTEISDWKTDKTVRTAYPPSSKHGYALNVSDYTSWRETTADGDVYDNPIKVSISVSATDGTAVSGGIMQGSDWIPHINRAVAHMYGVLYDISDDAMTLQSSQEQLDSMMHGSTELVNVVETQA